MSKHADWAKRQSRRRDDHLTDEDHDAMRALRLKRDAEAWALDFSASSSKARGQKYPLEIEGSDAHFPNEDRQTWRMFLRAIIDTDPDRVRLKGDMMDLESCSSHRPTGASGIFDVEDECGYTRRRLAQVDEALARADKKYRKGKPKSGRRKIYEMGNHEARFRRAKGGIDPVWRRTIDSLPKMLDLDETGWEWVEIPLEVDWKTGKKRKGTQPVMDGEVAHHHGESFAKNHAATQAANRAISQMYGHTHRAQQMYYVYPDLVTGEMTRVVCVTGLPCMCRTMAPWTAQPGMSNWTQGFALTECVGDFRFSHLVVIRRDSENTAHGAYGRWRWSVAEGE